MSKFIENRLSIRLLSRVSLVFGLAFVLSSLSCSSGNSAVLGNSDPSDSGASGAKEPDAATPEIAIVFSTLPATLYVGQSVPVSVTVTTSVPVTDLWCYSPSYSANLFADNAATTCASTIEPNTPCVYAFTFKSWPSQMSPGDTEMQTINELDCWSSLFNGPRSHFFYVTVSSTSLTPVDDAGASYCTSSFTGTMDAGSNSIQITSVPPKGQMGYVTGLVSVDTPVICYMVAVYINVDGYWWIKPTYDWPLTTINPDGTWSAYITTGGHDQDATAVVAYLVPNGYEIPSGGQWLPDSIVNFPSAMVTR